MDGCPTILADSWPVLKISLTKLDKMNSNGDFLPLTRTPKVGNTTLGVFLCCSLVAQAREMGRFDKWGDRWQWVGRCCKKAGHWSGAGCCFEANRFAVELGAVLNRQGGFSFEMASGFDFESTGGLARTDLDSQNAWMVCYIIRKQLFKADVRAISSSVRIRRR